MDSRIPSSLDSPDRVLLWTIDEFFVLFLPFVLGIIFEFLIKGMMFAVVGLLAWKKIKKGRTFSQFKAYLYWYLPSKNFRFRSTMHSYKRVLAG